MAAGGYQIDLEGVGSLINTLDHAEERMNSANNALKNSSPSDMGSRDIDAAGADFQDRWEHGISKIAEFTGSMVEALTQVRKAYADMDDQVSQMFGGGHGGGAPQQAPGSAITERLG